MEDKTYYGNQPKEIDEAYIDQLLSSPAVPKKEPVPQPEPEPEPVFNEPPAPAESADKAFPKPLLVLIAIALLGVGFLMGWLARGDRTLPADGVTTSTSPTYTWVEENEDYSSMSTMELVHRAVLIPEFTEYSLPTYSTTIAHSILGELKMKYPVLVELQTRQDAVEQLTLFSVTVSSNDPAHAANALIAYYVHVLGFAPVADSTPTNPGIALDYASMSTLELVTRAVQIPGLALFGNNGGSTMTAETYEALKGSNLVLIELEQRQDAVEQLTLYALSGSTPDYIHAANALISYFETFLGFSPADAGIYESCNMWIREIGDAFVAYEYPKAPIVTHTNIYGGSISGPCTVFDFDGESYVLFGQEALPGGEPNFWFRIELTQNAAAILADEPRPALEIFLGLAQDPNNTWALIQPYEGGWFVYGHAADDISVSFTFHPNPGENATYRVSLPVYPQPGDDATAMDVAEYVLAQGSEILAVQQIYGNLHYDWYPPLKRLLDTEGGISALLNLTQTKYDDFSNLSSVQPPYTIALYILSLPAVFHHMTGTELSAFNILKFYNGYFSLSSITSVPIQGPNSDIDPMWNLGNYRVGDTPEELAGMDVNEMNYWCYVSMLPGSQILCQENWTLEATLEDGSGVVGVWEVRDTATLQLTGWIVSGQFASPQNVYFRLKQGYLVLETQHHISQLLS